MPTVAQLWEAIPEGPWPCCRHGGGGLARRHHAPPAVSPRPADHHSFSESIMQTAAGSRAESFQQRYLSSWQTNKFYVLGFFLRQEIPPSLTKNKHRCYATSWRPD